jgi:hypothetical protein
MGIRSYHASDYRLNLLVGNHLSRLNPGSVWRFIRSIGQALEIDCIGICDNKVGTSPEPRIDL